MIKQIAVMHKNPKMTLEEFHRYWKDVHGPIAAKFLPGIRRYVQNHVVKVPGIEYEGDGIVEIWFDNVEAYWKSLEFLKSPEGKECADDAAKFAANIPSKMWLTEEHVIL